MPAPFAFGIGGLLGCTCQLCGVPAAPLAHPQHIQTGACLLKVRIVRAQSGLLNIDRGRGVEAVTVHADGLSRAHDKDMAALSILVPGCAHIPKILSPPPCPWRLEKDRLIMPVKFNSI